MPENSLIPKRFHVLSGSALKVLAITAMIIDHTGLFLVPSGKYVLMHFAGRTLTLYGLMRLIGRIAFPIFAFLLVEGFVHTHDRKKYGFRLFLFALLSEIPWNLAMSGNWLYQRQNVFFTLLLGYLGLWIMQRIRQTEDCREQIRDGCALIGLAAFSVVFHADYGISGFGFVLMMGLLRREPLFRGVLSCCMLPGRWRAGLSAIPISLYNGQRGFIHGKVMKIACYAIYPVQFLILYGLRLRIY